MYLICMNTLLVNLIAGPGAGKSTMMAGLFSELKWRGVDCEVVPEYAKDKVWEGSEQILDNQLYIFAKQHHRIWRLYGKVAVAITDSPLLLSIIYGRNISPIFKSLVLENHINLNNMTFFLERFKPYNPNGRLQTEGEAQEIDQKILFILDKLDVTYTTIAAERKSVNVMADMIEEKLG